jgi:hypothetical protein
VSALRQTHTRTDKMRREMRLKNPFIFLHIKNRSDDDWLKQAANGQTKFYTDKTRYWLIWRVKNVLSLKDMLITKFIGPVEKSSVLKSFLPKQH